MQSLDCLRHKPQKRLWLLLLCISLLVILLQPSKAGDLSFVKNTWTVGISGSGWVPGETITICVSTPFGPTPIGVVIADPLGKVKTSWANQSSSGASVQLSTALIIKGSVSTQEKVRTPTDGSFFASWQSPGGNGVGPLTNTVFATGLADAGLNPGFHVTLLSTSANGFFVNGTNSLDLTTDTLRTIGTYNLFSPGDFTGVYRITGVFDNLSDGNHALTGQQSLDGVVLIGTITPEGSSLWLCVFGLVPLGLSVLRRQRQHAL